MLLIFKCLQAQDSPLLDKSNDNQFDRFVSGVEYLKKNEPEIALSQFHMAYIYGEKSDLGITARSKIDSLLPIVQKNIIKAWKGNWKLKELNYNPYPGKFPEYILFDESKITFYQKRPNGRIKTVRVEPIKFLNYDSMDVLDTDQVVFKNSEVWRFSLSSESIPNRLYPTIVKDSLGGMKILLDERRIIRDKIMREKALKKEIHTYYIKSK